MRPTNVLHLLGGHEVSTHPVKATLLVLDGVVEMFGSSKVLPMKVKRSAMELRTATTVKTIGSGTFILSRQV